jgi:transcriptional regulator with XRE-family HTH domain
MIMITPRLCRAARGLLDWSRQRLASGASLSLATVAEYERGARPAYESTREKLQTALEAGGVVFLSVGKVEGVGAERKP